MRLEKIVEATDAVAVIHAGDTVASAGYAGSGAPDQLFVSLEWRFLIIGKVAPLGFDRSRKLQKNSFRALSKSGFAKRLRV